MRDVTWNQVRERFYRNHDPLPRDKWRATNPNARVAVDLKREELPESPCQECQGKGWIWKHANKRGKGVAKVLTKCECCKGTGESNAVQIREQEKPDAQADVETDGLADEKGREAEG